MVKGWACVFIAESVLLEERRRSSRSSNKTTSPVVCFFLFANLLFPIDHTRIGQIG